MSYIIGFDVEVNLVKIPNVNHAISHNWTMQFDYMGCSLSKKNCSLDFSLSIKGGLILLLFPLLTTFFCWWYIRLISLNLFLVLDQLFYIMLRRKLFLKLFFIELNIYLMQLFLLTNLALFIEEVSITISLWPTKWCILCPKWKVIRYLCLIKFKREQLMIVLTVTLWKNALKNENSLLRSFK